MANLWLHCSAATLVNAKAKAKSQPKPKVSKLVRGLWRARKRRPIQAMIAASASRTVTRYTTYSHFSWMNGSGTTSVERRYLLFSNTRSLFSVVALRRGVSSRHALVEALHRSLWQFLHATGHSTLLEQKLEPLFRAGDAAFATNKNRSVVGSMNDLAFLAESYLEPGDLDLVEVHRRVNSAPMSALDMASPAEVFLGVPRRTFWGRGT